MDIMKLIFMSKRVVNTHEFCKFITVMCMEYRTF